MHLTHVDCHSIVVVAAVLAVDPQLASTSPTSRHYVITTSTSYRIHELMRVSMALNTQFLLIPLLQWTCIAPLAVNHFLHRPHATFEPDPLKQCFGATLAPEA